jgi:parallel beta-helix repeat protein
MSLSKNKVIAAAVESLESRTLMSNTWYVSNSGNDGAVGTEASPLATLQAALDHANSGDRILLRSGTYDGNVRIDKSDLIIRSARGEMASIVSPTDDQNIGVTVRIGEDANNVKLACLDISGGYYYAVKTESTWDSGAPDPHGPSGLILKNNKLHDSGADVVKLTPATNGAQIIGNEIYNSGRTGPDNAEGIDAVQANDAVVRGNWVHDITTNGIYFKGGSRNTLIENNRVNNIGYSGILLGQSSDENWFDTATNPGYFENIDGTVRNNLVWDCQGAGIGAWAALRPQIYNNTMINVAQTMFGGLLIQGQEHWPVGYTGNDGMIIPSQDVTMYNNIVQVNSGRPVLNIRESGLTGSLNMSNNVYWAGGSPLLIQDDVHGYSGGLVGWQKSQGVDQGSMNVDPKVDAGADFKLFSDSPAINHGASSPATYDFAYDSRPLLGATDIGAQEFAG